MSLLSKTNLILIYHLSIFKSLIFSCLKQIISCALFLHPTCDSGKEIYISRSLFPRDIFEHQAYISTIIVKVTWCIFFKSLRICTAKCLFSIFQNKIKWRGLFFEVINELIGRVIQLRFLEVPYQFQRNQYNWKEERIYFSYMKGLDYEQFVC